MYFVPIITILIKKKKNRELDMKMRWHLENTSSDLFLKTPIIIRSIRQYKTKVASLLSRLQQVPLISMDGVKLRGFTTALTMTFPMNRAALEIVANMRTSHKLDSNTKLPKSIMKERAVHPLKRHQFLHVKCD